MLYITKVLFENVMAFDHYAFEPGKVTMITGRNGTGKTSTIESIRAALGGGSLASLIRDPEKPARVVICMSDGTEISKSQMPGKRTAFAIKDPKYGGLITKGAAELAERLYDIMQANPAKFLNAKDEDRAQMLLETVPLKFTKEQIVKLAQIGILVEEQNVNVLDFLDQHYNKRYDERTGVNSLVKKSAQAIAEFEDMLKDVVQYDASEYEGLLELRRTKERERDASAKVVEDESKLADNGFVTAHRELTDKARAEYEAEWKAAQDKRDAALKEADEWLLAQREARDEHEKSLLVPIEERWERDRSEIDVKLGAAKQAAENEASHRKTREILEKRREEFGSEVNAQTRLNAQMEAIEAVRQSVISMLPIPGLSVRGGRVFYNDLEFSKLNKALQVEIAVKVAALRAGELGIICIDELEHLDPENQAALIAYIETTNLQLIATSVAPGEFKVETRGEVS